MYCSNEVVNRGSAIKRSRQYMDVDEGESHSIPMKRKGKFKNFNLHLLISIKLFNFSNSTTANQCFFEVRLKQ